MRKPAFLIAADKSGSGKTTITIGLIYALKKKGYSIATFKCGPDYIDTAHLVLDSVLLNYNIAKILNLPVIIVIDASKSSASVAVLAKSFEELAGKVDDIVIGGML